MRIINRTKIGLCVIGRIIERAGVSTLGPIKETMIVYGNKAACRADGEKCLITIPNNNLALLAHEIRHLAQHSVGLGPIMAYERENVPYWDRAHEVDARAFEELYRS